MDPQAADARQFMIEEGKLQVLILQPCGPSLKGVLEQLRLEKSIQIIECFSADYISNVLKSLPKALLIAHVQQPEQLFPIVSLLKLLAERIVMRQVRVMVTTSIGDAMLQDKLRVYGCDEILKEPIPAKGLLFKVQRTANAAMRETAPERRKTGAKKGAAKKTAPPAAPVKKPVQNKPPLFKLGDPLLIESDCWSLRDGSARKVAGRWMVRLRGPGPLSGRWIETEGSGDLRCWEWQPLRSDDPFIQEQGAWKFYGERIPEAQDFMWSFTGRDIRLSFVYEGESYGEKFKPDASGTLVIAKDAEKSPEYYKNLSRSWQKVIHAASDEADRDEQLKQTVKSRLLGDSYDDDQDASVKDAAEFAAEEADQDSLVTVSSRKKSEAQHDPAGETLDYRGKQRGKANAEEKPEVRGTQGDQEQVGSRGGKRERPQHSGDAAEFFRNKGTEFDYVAEAEPEAAWNRKSADKKAAKAAEFFKQKTTEFDYRDKAQDPSAELEYEGESKLPDPSAELDAEDQSDVLQARKKRARRAEEFDEREKYVNKRRHDSDLGGTEFDEVFKSETSGTEFDYAGKAEKSGKDLDLAIAEEARSGTPDLVDRAEEERKSQDYREERKSERDVRVELGLGLGQEGAGPSAVLAERPPGPTLSPLALAFLVSELSSRRDYDLARIAEKYCVYLSASCGGLKSELWFRQGGGWQCVARSSGKREHCLLIEGIAAQELKKGKSEIALGMADASGAVVGAIVVYGDGAELVKEQYLKSASRAIQGLLRQLREGVVPAQAAA